MHRPTLLVVWPCFLACSAPLLAAPVANPYPPIPAGPITIELTPVATGLGSPNHLTHAGDGSGRLFYSDQNGRFGVIQPGGQVETFLNLTPRLVGLNANFDERGFLGFAFHPGYTDPQSPGFGKLYTYTSEPAGGITPDYDIPASGSVNHHSVIAEWIVSANDPDVVDTNSRREILRIAQPQSNHNAGHMAFGPEGNLYVALGDGGGGNDNASGHVAGGNGQSVDTVLGKILRIDPLGNNSPNGKYGIPLANPLVNQAGLDEIFAYGLRNPFRFSFDDLPGGDDRLIVSDVGQNQIEEINVVQPGDNLGWNRKEGEFKFDPNSGTLDDDLTGLPAGLTDPVAAYDHSEGTAIIGGFIYRGAAIPELQGLYVFGDFAQGASGRLFYADLGTGEIRELILGFDDRALGARLKGIGQDATGELYALVAVSVGPLGSDGAIYRIVPVPEPATVAALAALTALLAMRRARGPA